MRGGRAGGNSATGAGASPVSTARPRATSSTDRAISPIVSRLSDMSFSPARWIAPKLGLKPTTPQKEAGRSTDPPVCVPRASGTIPSATAAAEPLEEPPGVWLARCGLVVGPGST